MSVKTILSRLILIGIVAGSLLPATILQASEQGVLASRIKAIKEATDFRKPDTIHGAIQQFRGLLRVRPRSYELNWRISELYTTLARYYAPNKQTSLRLFEKAIRFARRAREIHPDRPEGLYRFAAAIGGWGLANGPLHSLHLVPQMTEALTRCAASAPRGTSWNTVHADCIRFQARLLYEVPRFPLSIGNVEQARGLLEEAIREQPDYVDNYLYLANLEQRQNHRKEVAQLADTAAALIHEQETSNYQSYRKLHWPDFDIRKMRFFNAQALNELARLRRWVKSPKQSDQ